MKKRVSVKTLYLVGIITIGLIVLGIGSTYAMFTTSAYIESPITINTNLTGESEVIEMIDVTLAGGESKEVTLILKNDTNYTLNYASWYKSDSNNIRVGTKLSNSDSSPSSSTIASGETKKVYVQLKNMSSSSNTITLGAMSNVNNIELVSVMTLVPNSELDYSLPSLDITYTRGNSRTITYTFTFSKDVYGFEASDITISEGTKGAFTQISQNKYTLVVTYNSDGNKTVSVASGVCQDSSGNNNLAKSVTNVIDTTIPTVSISTANISSNKVTYSFVFSEDVYDFTASDITINEGTKGSFTQNSQRSYSLVVTHSSSGTKKITVVANACYDKLGNYNNEYSYSHNLSFDTTSPTVTISANTNTSKTVTYTFSFSENVYDFTKDDITVSEGTKSTFTQVSQSKYTLVVIHSSAGTKTISVPSGVCTDSAGNYNIANSFTNTITLGVNFATYITNLYNSNTKSSFEYNKITYNRVESLSLINDRLGSFDTDIDGGNIRYYGTSPNNYVYFNCVSYPTTNCEVWRIVGVFDGKVKIIRSGSLASLSWDQQKNVNSSSTVFSSNWKTSSLNDLLNNKYYNGDIVGTVTYYSLIGATDTTELNMAQIGLRNRNTRSLVKKVTWNLGGISSGLLAVDGSYQAERGTSVAVSGYPTTIDTYIGLPYISDAGYASDLTSSACTIAMLPFTCIDSNWLHSLVYNAWTLTQYSKEKQKVWSFKAEGSSGVGYDDDRTWSKKGVVPTLFLDDSVKINDVGTGTQNNPYQLIVE